MVLIMVIDGYPVVNVYTTMEIQIFERKINELNGRVLELPEGTTRFHLFILPCLTQKKSQVSAGYHTIKNLYIR